MLTKTIHPADPSGNSAAFELAKQTKLSITARHACDIVRGSDVLRDANVLNLRFVILLKGTDTPCQLQTARIVVQGLRFGEWHMHVHSLSAAWPASVRLFVTISVMRSHSLRSCDVTQAYLKGTTNLAGVVYGRPPASWLTRKPTTSSSEKISMSFRPLEIIGITVWGLYSERECASRHLQVIPRSTLTLHKSLPTSQE